MVLTKHNSYLKEAVDLDTYPISKSKHNSYLKEAVDLDTYPISKLIRPWCAERAKRGPGKPVLIMHIVFFAVFTPYL